MPPDQTIFFFFFRGSELKPEIHVYIYIYIYFFFFCLRGNKKYFIFVTEQQHDKTNNMISVPSKDSDQVGHTDFLQF